MKNSATGYAYHATPPRIGQIAPLDLK